MRLTKTSRGFDVVDFEDHYQHPCSLQKSSMAEMDCVWLGVNDPTVRILAKHAPECGKETGWVTYPMPKEVCISGRMHLTREQVRQLLPYLIRFVETGDLAGGVEEF